MREWFQIIIDHSVVFLYVFCVVLVVRFFLKRWNRRYAYYLWAAVYLSLCLPAISGPFSLIPRKVADFSVTNMMENVPENDSINKRNPQDRPENTDILQNRVPTDAQVTRPNRRDETYSGLDRQELDTPLSEDGNGFSASVRDRSDALWQILSAIWFGGMLAIWMIFVFRVIRLNHLLKSAHSPEADSYGRVRYLPGDQSPFVWGIVRPIIYLPTGLTDEELAYIVAHEKYHLHRRDHLFKLIAGAITSAYWMNPLVWISYLLMIRDMEASCDIAVIESLTERFGAEKAKREYAGTLLKYAARQNGFILLPLTFGQPSVKERISDILKYKKRGVLCAGIVLAAVAVLIIGLIFRPDVRDASKEHAESTERTESTEHIESTERIEGTENIGSIDKEIESIETTETTENSEPPSRPQEHDYLLTQRTPTEENGYVVGEEYTLTDIQQALYNEGTWNYMNRWEDLQKDCWKMLSGAQKSEDNEFWNRMLQFGETEHFKLYLIHCGRRFMVELPDGAFVLIERNWAVNHFQRPDYCEFDADGDGEVELLLYGLFGETGTYYHEECLYVLDRDPTGAWKAYELNNEQFLPMMLAEEPEASEYMLDTFHFISVLNGEVCVATEKRTIFSVNTYDYLGGRLKYLGDGHWELLEVRDFNLDEEDPDCFGNPWEHLDRQEAQLEAYKSFLTEVMETEVVNGIDLRLPMSDDIHESEFLLCDVDFDQSMELLLKLQISVQPYTEMFDYDAKTGEVYREGGFALDGVRFYDNGVVEMDFDHNQGVGPDDWSIFYPYEVLVYDWWSDSYLRWTSVDAWDKASNPKDYTGRLFPDDIDKDGDGIIYHIAAHYEPPQEQDGERVWPDLLCNVPYQAETEYVDGADYEAWIRTYRDGANEISLPAPLKLTAKNIEKLNLHEWTN